MQSTENKHVLTILEAFPEDEGLYKCLITNPAGHTSTSGYLKIERMFFMLLISNEIDELILIFFFQKQHNLLDLLKL